VIVTAVAVVIEFPVAVNVADVAPAAMVTELGIVTAAGWERVKATTAPPLGAGPLKLMVPVLVPPGPTDAGLTETAVSDAGCTTRSRVRFVPLYAAVTVTGAGAATATGVIVNVEDEEPAGTEIAGGTAAALGFELVSVTVAPPAGATVSSVTTPVAVCPPTRIVPAGESASDCTPIGVNVTVAVLLAPP
jgi:hypothetical protein